MVAGPQGGSFQVKCNLDPRCPVSEVHGVFGNRDSPSTSGKLPRATVIMYNILQVFWTSQKEVLHAYFGGFVK